MSTANSASIASASPEGLRPGRNGRRALALVVGALAAATPMASAHDAQQVGGERKEGSMTWTVPLPALALPSFELTFDNVTVDSNKVPGMLGGGKLIMIISGASTAPKAAVEQHCEAGLAGGSITVARVSPGATVEAWLESATGTRQRLGGHSIPEGGRPTVASSSLCQGL